MTTDNEIKNTIKKSMREILDEYNHPKKPKIVEVLGVILTPLVIASVSLLVTYKINKSQAINARMIANAQIESAQRMAEAQRDHNDRIAKAELEVQRIDQIDAIFREIIKIDKGPADLETKKMLIGSLTVHQETSLPYLVRIRDHFDSQDATYTKLSTKAREIIEEVLTRKHLELKGMNFSGNGDGEQRILRYAKLQNYNLSGVMFENCNLFKASFTRSLLSNTSFKESDLFGADFSHTKLDGANFDGADLRKAVFVGSKIAGAHFENAKYLEDAKFSLSSILKNYKGKSPFEKVKNDTMLELLTQHIDQLKNMDPKDPDLLVFLKRFEKIFTYEELVDNLENRKKRKLFSEGKNATQLESRNRTS